MQANLSPSPLAVGAPTQLKEGLKLIRDLYTDYTLTCKGQVFPVHRLILHTNSKSFAASLSDHWKEAPAGHSREIADFEPGIVVAMLDWFYTSGYHVPENLEGESEEMEGSKLLFHLKVYELADFYKAEELMSESVNRFALASGERLRESSELMEAVRFVEEERRQDMHDHDRLRAPLLHAVCLNLEKLVDEQEFVDLMSESKEFNVALIKKMREDMREVAPGARGLGRPAGGFGPFGQFDDVPGHGGGGFGNSNVRGGGGGLHSGRGHGSGRR